MSTLFTGGESDGPGNRFADSWIGDLPIPLPKNYVLGLDLQRRDFEDFAHASYLRGKWKATGWWYYYLYGLTVKVPLGTWVLFLSCLVSRVLVRRRAPLSFRDELVLLAPATVIFALVSSQTGFSHNFRYALPCFPFLFVWISQIVVLAHKRPWLERLAAVAIVSSVASALWIYPHSLSYFNELAGGPRNGHAHLLHSSIDWGQDLLYLRRWVRRHPEAGPLYLAYYSYLDPRQIGMDYELPPQTLGPEGPREQPVRRMLPGRYAISVNYLRGFRWKTPENAFVEFRKLTPVAMAGYSIYIYDVSLADVHQICQERGLPPLSANRQGL